MRLFYIDHGLTNRSGHNWNLALDLREAFKARGINPEFVIHRNAIPEVVQELNATPAYPYSLYQLGSRDPLSRGLEDMMVFGHGFAAGCRALDQAGISQNDVMFLPVTFQNELYGLIQWLARRSRQHDPKFAINFMVENYLIGRDGEVDVLRAQVYRFCMKQLIGLLADDRIILTAQLAESVERWQQLLNVKVHEMPLPVDVTLGLAGQSFQACPQTVQTRVACLGMGRTEKGFTELPAVVDQVLATDAGIDFFLQVSPAFMEERWPDGWAEAQPDNRVTVWRGELSTQDYRERFLNAHILFLNYQPETYRYRTSAIFEEARSAGRIVVTPRQTWMGTQIENDSAAGVTYDDTQGIMAAVAALSDASKRRDELLQKAKDIAVQYQHIDNSKIFVDKFINLIT